MKQYNNRRPYVTWNKWHVVKNRVVHNHIPGASRQSLWTQSKQIPQIYFTFVLISTANRVDSDSRMKSDPTWQIWVNYFPSDGCKPNISPHWSLGSSTWGWATSQPPSGVALCSSTQGKYCHSAADMSCWRFPHKLKCLCSWSCACLGPLLML